MKKQADKIKTLRLSDLLTVFHVGTVNSESIYTYENCIMKHVFNGAVRVEYVENDGCFNKEQRITVFYPNSIHSIEYEKTT